MNSGVKLFYFFGEKDWMDRREFMRLMKEKEIVLNM